MILSLLDLREAAGKLILLLFVVQCDDSEEVFSIVKPIVLRIESDTCFKPEVRSL